MGIFKLTEVISIGGILQVKGQGKVDFLENINEV
jgi:hypothetical protein